MLKELFLIGMLVLLLPTIFASCSDINLQINGVDTKESYVTIQRLMGTDEYKLTEIKEIKIYIDDKLELIDNNSIQQLESRRLKIPISLSEEQEIKLEAIFNDDVCEYNNCKIKDCTTYQQRQLAEENHKDENLTEIRESTFLNQMPVELISGSEKETLTSSNKLENTTLIQNQSEENSSTENSSTNPVKIILNWFLSLFKLK